MGDKEMNKKHSDQKERYAVCQSFWDNRNKKKHPKSSLVRIEQSLYNTPWSIPVAYYDIYFNQYQNYLKAVVNGNIFSDLEYNADPDSESEIEGLEDNKINGIPIISVDGTIGKHLSELEIMFGGIDLDTINKQIADAKTDAEIKRVGMYFNTPGGIVVGTPETADLIAELAKEKEVIGYADMLCTSAGMWLASQCSKFFVAGSARIGSVNVYSIYLDNSKQLETEGTVVNAITGSFGKYKLTGASFKKMTDDEKTMLQSQINAIESDFIFDVMKRGIKMEDCTGEIFDGETAVKKNFADGIIPTYDDFIEAVTSYTE
jgi:ClpP class serine protease